MPSHPLLPSTLSSDQFSTVEQSILRYQETICKNPFIPHEPSVKQQIFLLHDDVREAVFGGAAGGGKSDALLMAAAQYVHVPGYSALLLRRSFSDLMQADGLIPRSKDWWSQKASWSAQEKRWTFPSGATITFGYLDRDDDVYQYQGAAFQCCCIDELTQHTEFRYRYLFSRLRRPTEGALASVPLRMRSATNPGGVGHEWVRKRLISPQFLTGKGASRFDQCWWHTGRLFVPARRVDNAHLDQAAYAASLAELPPVTRAQLDEGDWQAHEGGHFKRHWFREYRDFTDSWLLMPGARPFLKSHAQIVIAVDPAGGVSDDADYTAMVVGARCGYDLLILDVVRDRIAVEGIVPRLLELCLQWQPAYVVMENEFLQSQYVRQARATPGIPTVHAVGTEGRSKLVRATPAILRAEQGSIYIPERELHWREDFLSEVCSFVGDDKLDAHDDQVDALSWLVLAVDRFRLGAGDDGPMAWGARGR